MYSDSLRVGWSRDRIPGGGGRRDFPDRHWDPSSLMHYGYRVFPGGKAAGAWRWPPPPSSAEAKERIELFPLRLWWPVLGWTLPLLVTVEMHAKRWSAAEVGKLGRCGMNGRLRSVRVWIGLICLAAICMVVHGLDWSAERLLFLEEDFAKCLTETVERVELLPLSRVFHGDIVHLRNVGDFSIRQQLWRSRRLESLKQHRCEVLKCRNFIFTVVFLEIFWWVYGWPFCLLVLVLTWLLMKPVDLSWSLIWHYRRSPQSWWLRTVW